MLKFAVYYSTISPAVQKKSETGIFKIFSHVDKTFPVLINIRRSETKILREKIKIIDWPIFSRAAGAMYTKQPITDSLVL